MPLPVASPVRQCPALREHGRGPRRRAESCPWQSGLGRRRGCSEPCGYPYPDNHKVHYILYGDRGLIAKGMILRVGEGLFRVPEELDIDALETQPAKASS